MKAIMLCAGYATRLYPLTKNQPKPLLLLAGKPIINYLLEKMGSVSEIDEIFVVTNEKFYSVFQDWKKKFYPKRAIEIVNDQTTNNENRLGAIRDIQFVLKTKNIQDDILVLASDNYFDFDLKGFVRYSEQHRPHATVAVYDVQDAGLAKQYGLVACNEQGLISAFLEKPENPTTTLASTGVYFFSKESLPLFDRYLEGHANPDAPGYYIKWLVEHEQVFAFSFKGTWYDIGDFESYRKVDSVLQRAI